MLGSFFPDACGADKHIAARDTCYLFSLIIIFFNGLVFTFFPISLFIFIAFYESISPPQIERKKMIV